MLSRFRARLRSFLAVRLIAHFVQAAFAAFAEIGGARRAPQNAQRSAAAAAKPLPFEGGEAALKGAPRPVGVFADLPREREKQHFPYGCGVLIGGRDCGEIESRASAVRRRMK